MHLILGSTSPRRREILSYFSIPFSQASPEFDEESVVFNGDPVSYAVEIAVQKAASLVPHFPDDYVLTADTVVYCEGNVYNKPSNRDQAAQFLRAFSGKWQEVTTALVLRKGRAQHVRFEKTRLHFCPLTPSQIERYIDHFQTSDKAGGYSIQAAGSILVAKIDGCYYNVLGLPLQALKELLLCEEIDLWEYIPRTCNYTQVS